MARGLGAEFALREGLREAFPDAGVDFDGAVVPDDWSWRLQSSTTAVYMQALRMVPWRSRARVIFRILWPTTESLKSGPIGTMYPHAGAWRLRILRASAGLRELRGRRDD